MSQLYVAVTNIRGKQLRRGDIYFGSGFQRLGPWLAGSIALCWGHLTGWWEGVAVESWGQQPGGGRNKTDLLPAPMALLPPTATISQ